MQRFEDQDGQLKLNSTTKSGPMKLTEIWVLRSRREVPMTRRAAAFWTACNRRPIGTLSVCKLLNFIVRACSVSGISSPLNPSQTAELLNPAGELRMPVLSFSDSRE